jgi:hypothetical protein
MVVPKTAVDEYNSFDVSENKIGFPWQTLGVRRELNCIRNNKFPHIKLRTGVSRFDLAHDSTAGRF